MNEERTPINILKEIKWRIIEIQMDHEIALGVDIRLQVIKEQIETLIENIE